MTTKLVIEERFGTHLVYPDEMKAGQFGIVRAKDGDSKSLFVGSVVYMACDKHLILIKPSNEIHFRAGSRLTDCGYEIQVAERAELVLY